QRQEAEARRKQAQLMEKEYEAREKEWKRRKNIDREEQARKNGRCADALLALHREGFSEGHFCQSCRAVFETKPERSCPNCSVTRIISYDFTRIGVDTIPHRLRSLPW